MSMNHRRISFSIAAGMFLEFINKISPLIILHHAQKTLGTIDFGWAQLQLAFFEALQPFITYGYLNYALATDGVKKGDSEAYRANLSYLFWLKVVQAVLLVLVFISLSAFGVTKAGTPYQSFDVLAVVAVSCILDAYWVFISEHKLAKVSLFAGLLRILSLFLIVSFVRSSHDKSLFVYLSLMPNLILASASGIYAFHKYSWQRVFPKAAWTIFRKATPFAIVCLLAPLCDRLDLFLVETWFGLEQAGIYAGPARIIQSLSMMLWAVAIPFYAETLKVDDAKSLTKHVSVSLWLLSAIISPIIFGTPFIEKEILGFVFTGMGDSGLGLLTILGVGMIGSAMSSVFGLQVLIAKSRAFKVVMAYALGIIMAILFGLVAKDTSYGLRGIAVTSVAAKFLLGFSCMWQAREYLINYPISALVKPLMAGALMALGLAISPLDSVLARIILGGAYYLIALILLNLKELKAILSHPKIQRLFKITN